MAVGKRQRPARTGEITADFYATKLQQLSQAKPTCKKLSPVTEEGYKLLHKKWDSHCTLIRRDPTAHLGECRHENFKNFLHWIVNGGRIKKYSAIYQYWRRLKNVYSRTTGQYVDFIVNEEVLNYLEGPLAEEFELDFSIREKPVMSVDDLVNVLHFHWALDTAVYPNERQRLQMSFLLLVLAYTGTRPGAIVESGAFRGSNQALRYGDIDLVVLRNPYENQRHVLIMVVRLVFNKNERGKQRPKPFVFHERDDVLNLCPVAQFMALALDDDAFEATNLKSVQDILGVRVPHPRNCLQLKWKKSMLDVPVCRRAVRRANGIYTSPTQALAYDSVNKYAKRLGRFFGFAQSFTAYCIRRATANALDDVATTAERNLILGHSRSSVFEKYYLTQKKDVQSAYLGVPSQDALIRQMGQMSLNQDPRAPKTLTFEQSATIERQPELKQLQQERKKMLAELKSEYGSIEAAKRTDSHREYTKLLQDYRCEREIQRMLLLKQVTEEWHDSIHTIEVEKQAYSASMPTSDDNKDDSKDKDNSNPLVFEERSRVASALFRSLTTKMKLESSGLDLRIQVVTDMVALCSLREVPRRQKPSCDGYIEILDDDTTEPDLFPIVCPGTQCLFCLGNEQLSHAARTFSFARLDILQKHVESAHLRYFDLHQSLTCPHPSCEVILDGLEHFLNHAQRVHNNKLARDNFLRSLR